jgi:hypothetical protein
MTPVTFQGLSNLIPPYHDEPAQLSMRSITAISASVDGMLVADKEYVTIVRLGKAGSRLSGQDVFT